MASLILNGSTSGSITISSPSVSGSNTLTLPASTGTVVVTSGAQTIEFADGSASTPSITNSGDTNTGMFFPAADTVAFAQGGAESMRINSSGNVGIGTTSPFGKLNVVGPQVISSITAPLATTFSRLGLYYYENTSLADDHTAITLIGSSGYEYFTCVVEVVVTNGDTIETAATVWVDSRETTVTSTNLGGINSTNIAVVNGTTGTDNKFNICCNSQVGSSFLAIRNRMGGARRAYIHIRVITVR